MERTCGHNDVDGFPSHTQKLSMKKMTLLLGMFCVVLSVFLLVKLVFLVLCPSSCKPSSVVLCSSCIRLQDPFDVLRSNLNRYQYVSWKHGYMIY